MEPSYSLDVEAGILECDVYSIKGDDIEKSRELKEKLGIDLKEEFYGEPIRIVIDFPNSGGISYFLPYKVELCEKDNFVNATYIEFENGLNFVVLIQFDEFKELYYAYKFYEEEDFELIKPTFFQKLKDLFK